MIVLDALMLNKNYSFLPMFHCQMIRNIILLIKNEKLKELIFTIWEKEKILGLSVSYNHVRREGNKKADALVNLALDNLI